MATIGTFHKQADGSFAGAIRTLTLNVKQASLRPNDKTDERAPDFRIFAAGVEFGAAWSKTSRENRDYISVKLDDAVFVGPDLVLLDIAADAYLCLPDLSASAELGQDGALRLEDPSAARSLRTAGLLSDDGGVRAPPPPLPTRSLPQDLGPIGWRHWLRLLLCCGDLLLAYPGRSFAAVLRPWLKRAASTPPIASPEVLRLAEVFRRLVPWAPVPRKCLVRSFLLKRFLERSGCRAAWVFGVRTWPFGAHCWIQAGDLALDDQPERLAVYTPILAV